MAGEFVGRVIRHLATKELLWLVGFEDDPTKWPDGGPGPTYQALCLTGVRAGRTRHMTPASIEDWCEVLEANYESAQGLSAALLEGLVSV